MTVKELIRLLETYPSHLRVVVNGYEEGYDDVSPERVRIVEILLNRGTRDWEGEHMEYDGASKTAAADSGDAAQALAIHRTSN